MAYVEFADGRGHDTDAGGIGLTAGRRRPVAES
jgi:hypothetical protein